MKEELPKKISKELMAQDFTQTTHTALEIEKYRNIAMHYAELECQLAILSDIRRDVSYIYYGSFARQIGLSTRQEETISSIWEKEILDRIHPDDLHRKYIQELQKSAEKGPQRINVGMFLNNLNQSLARIQSSGIRAVSERRETEDEIVVTITIPK